MSVRGRGGRSAVVTIAAAVGMLSFASPVFPRTILPVDSVNHCSAAMLWPLAMVVVGAAIGILLMLDRRGRQHFQERG